MKKTKRRDLKLSYETIRPLDVKLQPLVVGGIHSIDRQGPTADGCPQ